MIAGLHFVGISRRKNIMKNKSFGMSGGVLIATLLTKLICIAFLLLLTSCSTIREHTCSNDCEYWGYDQSYVKNGECECDNAPSRGSWGGGVWACKIYSASFYF